MGLSQGTPIRRKTTFRLAYNSSLDFPGWYTCTWIALTVTQTSETSERTRHHGSLRISARVQNSTERQTEQQLRACLTSTHRCCKASGT